MSAVLLSIRPKQCELIVIKQKAIIIRKTRPTIKLPFICYIYETNATKAQSYFNVFHSNTIGKVVGEFICDEIYQYSTENSKDLYGWHISNLKIYDKPKELNEFYSIDNKPITRPSKNWRYIKEISYD